MVLTTCVILAVLRACDVSLNLFHLVSLVLAAGLGLDYALFFEHAATTRRTETHAARGDLCACPRCWCSRCSRCRRCRCCRPSAVTVSLGVMSNFVLALLLTRERRGMSDIAHCCRTLAARA